MGEFKKSTATTTPTLLCTFLNHSKAQNKRKNKLKHINNKQNIYKAGKWLLQEDVCGRSQKKLKENNQQGLSRGPPNVTHTV